MKKFTHRLIPLVLCFTLTLGAFAYRPPEAKAAVGIDDAIVISALLSAFGCGVGLIFSNNGMSSAQIADGMAKKWEEYKAMLDRTPDNFADWLGYEDMDALLADCKVTAGNVLEIPKAMALKFKEFTEWFVKDAGLIAGEKKNFLTGPTSFLLANGSAVGVGEYRSDRDYDLSSLLSKGDSWTFSCGIAIDNSANTSFSWSYPDKDKPNIIHTGTVENCIGRVGLLSNGSRIYFVFERSDGWVVSYPAASISAYLYSLFAGDALNSSLDIDKDDTKNPPDITGENANPTVAITDADAATIEELLRQILEKMESNTLATDIAVDGTQAGDNTGDKTDEDAKPYLPYIPRIFEKIGELPNLIAEKIGAFFTTLWGWLQKVIDAIVSIPAAVAEKVGELFKPDEALVTEITDTFKGKFGFFATLKKFGSDLFGITAETEPPVIWVHLENAESRYGYVYGDKQKMLDLTWYQKYKPTVDGLLSGFLWLGYLWLLFKRAPSILNGMSMEGGLLPPLQTGGDVIDAPRIGSGDPSMHYGNGFTFRDKGGRRK